MEAIKLAVLLNAEYIPPHQSNAMLYIRPVVFGSGPQIALVPSEEYVFCVTVQPGTPYHGLLPLDAIVSEELDRAAPVGVGAAKIGGNYAPGIRHCLDAYRKGYPMVLFLDGKTRTKVEEFSTSAFLGIKEKDTSYVLVASNSKNVVNSITVDSCIQLAKSLGWKVERREVSPEQGPAFQHLMSCARLKWRSFHNSTRLLLRELLLD
jgi:branched-chain amino acid aminotransferase